ncbi:SIR2 family NAD-dependent protein deacylase [Parasedimentitalea psychrophila]|uniref:SIR2 family protein n=1 Tax=Parasedimentitalea psychrophila TaxID=2997337 RepID=A0A9Y2P8X8_9RHOB|nr:SIR2 family protein [Parasedimentitalea psychrophila]WIY27513.1 SIR2 family protein [Parasedimentitalea psychrophila]
MTEKTLVEQEPKQTRYERYVEEITEDITNTVQEFGVQPILFVGSGLSKRYMDGPSWEELLAYLADKCSAIEKGLGFYKQSLGHPIQIGQEFSKLYQDWAWAAGSNEFPKVMFGDDVNKHSYIKYKIVEFFKDLEPEDITGLNAGYLIEIEALAKIKPHAIITTNYDEMLEKIFPDHERIVGQQILRGQQVCIGELYKIHGCVTDHDSLVFTEDDYDEWQKKKKFLSAKLLTFFNEHPLIFIGYNAGDPNIKAILSDIDEAIPEKGGVIPNVYILQWEPSLKDESWPERDKIILTEGGRSVRVKMIAASDFSWVYDAFAASPALEHVNVKVLRALMARSYDFVRSDIPKMKIEADFKMLNSAVESPTSFAKLFGIANISDFSAAGALHPLSLTEVGKALGYNSWNSANGLIEQISQKKGVNIKKTDNRYHRAEKVNKTVFHKYSEDAIELLRKERDGEEYEVDV